MFKQHAIKLLLICISLAAIQSVIVASSNEQIEKKILANFISGSRKELFKVYHFLFKKEYDLNSEEGVKRFRIFRDNVEKMKNENGFLSEEDLKIDSADFV